MTEERRLIPLPTDDEMRKCFEQQRRTEEERRRQDFEERLHERIEEDLARWKEAFHVPQQN